MVTPRSRFAPLHLPIISGKLSEKLNSFVGRNGHASRF
jgi:hypothetical protein